MDIFPVSQQTQFTLCKSPDVWRLGVYCEDCMNRIHQGAWEVIKSDLRGVDCMAVFRSIQNHGLPTTLVERDVMGDANCYDPLSSIRTGSDGIERNVDLVIDLTHQQVIALENELRQLRSDIFEDDIKTIVRRYWPD